MRRRSSGPQYDVNLVGRRRIGWLWHLTFQVATLLGVVALAVLILNVINDSFGYVVLDARVDPRSLAARRT